MESQQPQPDNVCTSKILDFVKARRAQVEEMDQIEEPELAEAKTTEPDSFCEFTEDEVKLLYAKMCCRSCKVFPYPDKRYMCSRGHLYCSRCFENRESLFKTDDPEMSKDYPNVGLCGCKMPEADMQAIGWEYEKVSPSAAEADDAAFLEQEIMEKRCLRFVTHCTENDPLYTHLFRNSIWKCPAASSAGPDGENGKMCNNKGISGWKLDKHVAKCIQKHSADTLEQSSEDEF